DDCCSCDCHCASRSCQSLRCASFSSAISSSVSAADPSAGLDSTEGFWTSGEGGNFWSHSANRSSNGSACGDGEGSEAAGAGSALVATTSSGCFTSSDITQTLTDQTHKVYARCL